MERAHDAAKFGRLADEPMMEATIPSLVDPSLVEGAADGTHVMSVIVQDTPYTLRGTDWDAATRGVRGSRRRDARRLRARAGRHRSPPARS